MRLKELLFLAFLLLAVPGSAFAGKIESGKVTAVYHDKNVIEIDGRKFHCPGGEMAFIHKGEKVKYVVDYQYDDPKHRRAIIDIYPQ